MFGLYFVDAFGNKELIYRDPNISSVWAKPMSSRPVPPVTGGVEKKESATRDYRECDDLVEGATWKAGNGHVFY